MTEFSQATPPPFTHDEMIRFGDSTDAVMPLSWAERMLRQLAADKPAEFYKRMGAAANAIVNGDS